MAGTISTNHRRLNQEVDEPEATDARNKVDQKPDPTLADVIHPPYGERKGREDLSNKINCPKGINNRTQGII